MMKKIRFTQFRLALSLFVVALCTMAANAETPRYEELFKRTSGWTGADGTYSLSLGKDSTLWCFSDTFFGQVKDGRRQLPITFVNNSLIWQRGDKVQFLKAPVFQPPDRVGWFWLFDGLVVNRDTQAKGKHQADFLLGQFRSNGKGGAFGFEQAELWWARIQIEAGSDRVKVKEYRKLPLYEKTKDGLITFGSAITEVGPWAYVYGIKQVGFSRQAVLARAPKASLGVQGTWRFFDGKDWQRDIKKSATLFDGVSVEYSVHQTQNGEFVYIGGSGDLVSAEISARKAPSPEGPWGEALLITKAKEHKKPIFCYNPKAHPELTEDGKILISYNVNTTDLEQVTTDANIYRPRFLWWTPPSENWLP